MSTLLERYLKANPPPLFGRTVRTTAAQLARFDLDECRRELLEHASLAEYHHAMTDMLRKREKRLLSELRATGDHVVNNGEDDGKTTTVPHAVRAFKKHSGHS